MTKRRRIPVEAARLVEIARNLDPADAPRKHHLVPAFYLRRWATEGRIRVTDADTKSTFVTSPGKAARQTDFYRLESKGLDPKDVPPLLFEVMLGRIEEWGKSTIDRLAGAPVELSPQEASEFAWYLGLQFTRGASFRAELAAMSTEFAKLRYGSLSPEDLRELLQRSGLSASPKAVAAAQKSVEDLQQGSIVLRPADAAATAQAAQAAEAIGDHLLQRTWVVFETSRVLVTCDEPVVMIGGPGLPRGERAGAATAAVVVLPLDPSHVLAMFRDDVADELGGVAPPTRIARGELDHVETAELSREVAMNAHRWIFERPDKRVATRLSLAPKPEQFSMQDVGVPEVRASSVHQLVRTFKKTRWHNVAGSAPWPVSKWWT